MSFGAVPSTEIKDALIKRFFEEINHRKKQYFMHELDLKVEAEPDEPKELIEDISFVNMMT
jgi:hypothetical protein